MFHTALKFSWIKRLIVDTGDWQPLFEKQYNCNKKVLGCMMKKICKMLKQIQAINFGQKSFNFSQNINAIHDEQSSKNFSNMWCLFCEKP